MTEMYGHRWTASFGDSPSEKWAHFVDRADDAMLTRGLSALVKRGDDWPPSLPEFIRLCRPEKRENAAMYHCPLDRQLPKKLTDEDREKGREGIAAARKAL